MTQRPASACPWCGRSGGSCWAMPCLSLQTAIDSDDEEALIAFARACGSALSSRIGGLIVPALFPEDDVAGKA